MRRKAAFFAFWVLFFVAAHLWSFHTAPWNGGAMFDDAQRAVIDLKKHAIGHPFAVAWWCEAPENWMIESLFYYYIWPWFSLFGYSVVSDEMASLTLWCVTFLFTLRLTYLLGQSYVVTSAIALVFTFLPFAFIYSFVAFHYEMAPMFAVMSLYFLHRGSNWSLAVGGIAAGLCLWSSVLGQQYIVALALCAPFYWRQWRKGIVVLALFAASAAPIASYMLFHWHEYTYHASTRWNPTLDFSHIWGTFFVIPDRTRYFFPDALPIPLPYYALLVPGVAVALWKKRFDILLLATIPVAGVFVTGGPCVEHRLLVAIPFWMILIGFGFNFLKGGDVKCDAPVVIRAGRRHHHARFITLCHSNAATTVRSAVAAIIIAMGLVPSVQYIYAKAKDPTSIHAFDRRRAMP